MSARPIGTVISVAVGGVFLLGGLLAIVRAFLDQRRVARVVGDEFMLEADAGTYSVGRQAVRIREIKRDGLLFLLAALAVFMLVLWNQSWSYFWIVGILAGIGCARVSVQMMPATILILGRSASDTLELQALVNRYAPPFRAVSLLKMEGRVDEILVKSHCFRVGPGEDWVAAVEALCKLLPLIVLDIRSRTEFVKEEIRITLGKYRYKTLYITREEGGDELDPGPGEAGRPEGSAEIVSLTSGIAGVHLIVDLLHRARVVPSPETPLSDLLVRDPSDGAWHLRGR